MSGTTRSTPANDAYAVARWVLAGHPWVSGVIGRILDREPLGALDGGEYIPGMLAVAIRECQGHGDAWADYASHHPEPDFGGQNGPTTEWIYWNEEGPTLEPPASTYASMTDLERAAARCVAVLTTGTVRIEWSASDLAHLGRCAQSHPDCHLAADLAHAYLAYSV